MIKKILISGLSLATLLSCSKSKLTIKDKKKVEQYVTMNYPQTQKITLSEIKEKINKPEKWILYIANAMCGDCNDFREHVLPSVLDANPKIKLHYIDFFARKTFELDWDKIIGVKNGYGVEKPVPSPLIKNFTFNYTPTLLLIENGTAKFVWEDFGGGEKRENRYFRNQEDKKQLGYKNAISDLNSLLKKHY